MSIKSTITRAVGRQSLRVRQNSPHILFAGGIVGIVGSTVLACRATLKLEPVLDQAQDEIIEVRVGVEQGEVSKRDLAYVYGKSTLKVTKLYAPAAAVGTLSIVALTGAHVQLSRRNTALTVAYTGLHQAYNEYRARVREALGEENEKDLYFNTTTETIEDDKGKKHTIKTIDPNGRSMYARCFDEASPNWQKNPELNRVFVQCQQNYANQLLQARGHLFLNEVYDMLGFDRSQAGQAVGWVINDEGDNFVDFGMFEAYNAPFMNGQERSIWLDFNVDGVIYNKI